MSSPCAASSLHGNVILWDIVTPWGRHPGRHHLMEHRHPKGHHRPMGTSPYGTSSPQKGLPGLGRDCFLQAWGHHLSLPASLGTQSPGDSLLSPVPFGGTRHRHSTWLTAAISSKGLRPSPCEGYDDRGIAVLRIQPCLFPKPHPEHSIHLVPLSPSTGTVFRGPVPWWLPVAASSHASASMGWPSPTLVPAFNASPLGVAQWGGPRGRCFPGR